MMNPMEHHPVRIRTATAAEAGEVAGILAAGFHDDPVLAWVFPDDRSDKLGALFGFLSREALVPLGATYLTDGAAACWTPPNPPDWPDERGERFFTMLDAHCAADDLERFGVMYRAMEACHPPEPHWYLGLIATRPEAQGRGHGSALLDHTLRERIDPTGTLAYLEATSPRSVPLYERHGFEVVEWVELPGGPPFAAMQRTPG